MSKKILLLLLLFTILQCELKSQNLSLGDGVRITFYNITDAISGDYFIQKSGYIQLPYIGLIKAANVDFQKVQEAIIAKYDSLYKNPELTVQPLIKISILGEVRSPGIYYVTGIEGLLDILALAGGETSDANLNKIYFIRRNQRVNIDAKELIEEGKEISVVGLQSGDQIYVPRKWWVSIRNVSVLISGAAVLITAIRLFIK